MGAVCSSLARTLVLLFERIFNYSRGFKAIKSDADSQEDRLRDASTQTFYEDFARLRVDSSSISPHPSEPQPQGVENYVTEVAFEDIIWQMFTPCQLTPATLSSAMAKAIPPNAPFVKAYVAALLDEMNAILMIPAQEDRMEITIRITKYTAIGVSSRCIDCSTLFLTQEVKVFGVFPVRDPNPKYPTWTAAHFMATQIMLEGPLPTEIVSIGFAHREWSSFFQIISDETPDGFYLNRSLIHRESEEKPQDPKMGEMFMVKAYPLRRGTTIRKMPDMMFYATEGYGTINYFEVPKDDNDDVFSSDLKALSSIARTTEHQREACRLKGSPFNRSKEDYEFFIGRATASMSAYETFLENIGKDQCEVISYSNIAKTEFGVFRSTISFPLRGTDEELEAWAAGGSLMAIFPGKQLYKIPVNIKSFKKKQGKGVVTVEFPKPSSDFLTSWNLAAGQGMSVTYTQIESENVVFQAIKEGFGKLVDSKIFKQYVAAEKPMKPTQKLSEDQKKVGDVELDEYQVEAMETILFSEGISLTQAPPGSGKTVLVAAVTRELITSGEADTVILTGTTNISVDNALSALSAIADHLENYRPIRIASQRAMNQLVDVKKDLSNSEKAMGFEEYISSGHQFDRLSQLRGRSEFLREVAMEPAKSTHVVVDRHAKARLAKTKLENSFLEMHQPNVIATTTALLLRNRSKNPFRDATHIIIDEASQLPPTELLAILAAFPNLKKVAIIGDEYQLKPYLNLPEGSHAQQCFGTSDLVRLNHQLGTTATKLKKVYRSHPLMTGNLINSFYPYLLEAGATPESRNMAERLQLPRCEDGTPIRAYHVDGKEVNGCNIEEARSIIDFVGYLISLGVEQEDILILTFHRSQKAIIEREVPGGVRVKTVDSAQGQQARVTIVATTKTCDSKDPGHIARSLHFISNPNRGTVALTRGLEATYIFGNLKQLSATPFWRPVIESVYRRNGMSVAASQSAPAPAQPIENGEQANVTRAESTTSSTNDPSFE